MPGVPWLAGGLIVAVGVVAVVVLLLTGPSSGGVGAGASGSPGTSAGSSAAPGGSPAAGTCPTSQPDPLPAGQTRTVTLDTPKGTMAITVEADLSPIAAGNFVALASCGFYDGTPFHRTPTLSDGTPFVIQGGDPTGTGSGGPGYTIKDEPVTQPYKRGTVAMARTQAPDSVGSQFFIVLDDKDGSILGSANTYQIIGTVTQGMETADAIFAASGGVELPPNPIRITTATVTNP
ncbi:MAG TPA: peptidylprolyl isomerase [Candidatus Limnocylindrales bacterium]|nr:peptidylprolyl isomerase [Candidatus Limnocylindrales bacterium]